MELEYELKLSSGKVVTWAGSSGMDAAFRYVGAHPAETVVAWRSAERHGLHIGLAPIVEPGLVIYVSGTAVVRPGTEEARS